MKPIDILIPFLGLISSLRSDDRKTSVILGVQQPAARRRVRLLLAVKGRRGAFVCRCDGM
jgi:hypothetical protein